MIDLLYGVLSLAAFAYVLWAWASRRRIRRIRSRHIPQSVKIAVVERDGAFCRGCGATEDLQFDHIYPFSRGGSSTDPSNVQILCGTCNRRKSDRVPVEEVIEL